MIENTSHAREITLVLFFAFVGLLALVAMLKYLWNQGGDDG